MKCVKLDIKICYIRGCYYSCVIPWNTIVAVPAGEAVVAAVPARGCHLTATFRDANFKNSAGFITDRHPV